MTINFVAEGVAEGDEAFFESIKQSIMALKPNKHVRFKTTKGILGVSWNKRNDHFSVSLNGYGIEDLPTASDAAASVLSLYQSL